MNQSVLSQQESVRETRVQRKKREARERIIRTAETLMRSRPVDSVTIQDITSVADVGHGTFYLHFSSKYEVLLPIIQQVASEWDEVIQYCFAEADDPARVMCGAMRFMGRAILADPLWVWLLQHSGMPITDMKDAVGRFAARDFGKGLMSGRFVVPDLALTSSFMMGGYVTGLLAIAETGDGLESAVDQLAELLLRTLGIEAEEAAVIAHLPLPEPALNGAPIIAWQLPAHNQGESQ